MTDEEFQVVFLPQFKDELTRWLESRGLYLFRIPNEDDDLPTYGVGIKEPHNSTHV